MVYIIDEDPMAILAANPVVMSIEATDGLLLVQVPPAVASDKVSVLPRQMLGEPAIGEGVGLIVAVADVVHPFGKV